MNTIAEKTMSKVRWRLIPFVFVLYIIAALDRSNIAYAALQMNKELGLTATTFGMITGIFSVGYFIFEIPSNVMLHRYGARKWIARILITWGIVTVISTWVQNITQLYIVRFLLGVFEAGFFPGIILYLTFWFPAAERARAVALFMLGTAANFLISAPLATWILDNIRWFDMGGWRWLFFLEGLPAVLFGCLTYFLLPDRPENAKWLSEDEKKWLMEELNKEPAKLEKKKYSMGQVLLTPRLWRLMLIYFCVIGASNGINYFLPQIIKAFSAVISNTQIGSIAMIPYCFGLVAMVFWSQHSDKTRERRYHAIIPVVLGAIGMLIAGTNGDPVIKMIGITLTVMGIYTFYGPFWALPSMFLTEEAAAVGLAAINSVGNLGGVVVLPLIGYFKDITGKLEPGMFVVCATFILAALLVITMPKVDTIETPKKNIGQ